MAIPDYQTLMLPVLQLAAHEEKRVSDISDTIANQFKLTSEDRQKLLRSGRQPVLQNRIHWAKSYMSKAGLLSSPKRGSFIATDEGRQLLSTNPARIDVRLLMRYPTFRAFYRPDAEFTTPAFDTSDVNPVTPEEHIEAAYETFLSALKADLLDRILQNGPDFFERLIVDLLVAMGYGGSHKNAAEQLGRSGDSGVDGVINEDRLGLDRVYVQAKRYNPTNSIGRPDVQTFVGSLVGFGAQKGVFVTTSTFTSQAKDYVKNLPQRIVLIDGSLLSELMIEYNVGVRVSRALTFKRLDEDFFSED